MRPQAHRFNPEPTLADRAWVWAGLVASALGGVALLWVLFTFLLLAQGGQS